MNYLLKISIVIAVCMSFVVSSCTKINYTTDPESVLDFSKDTLMFDSVFATIGSVSLYLSVINPNDEALLVEDIYLEGGLDSQYRINVDGQGLDSIGEPLTHVEDVTILPGDSMYIFVEVTVDPTNSSSAFIVDDALKFMTNTVEQEIKLIAYGRNAYFHHQPGNWFNYNDPPDQVLDCDEVWTSDLPHVVYGPLRVEPGCSLTIEAGAEVYVHNGSGIWIQGGTLNVEGTLDEKVVFQGDRLEQLYSDEAGQWGLEFPIEFEYEGENVYFTVSRGGVWLDRSADSDINHAVFKNGTIGLWVDSVAAGSEYALNIANTEITNMSAVGILSQGGHIRGVNNLFTDCGEACGAFTIGGKIKMHLSTFANYWAGGVVRQGPSVFISDWYSSTEGDIHRPFEEGTEFRNCIIWGNNYNLDDTDEIVSSLYNASIYDSPLFKRCGLDINDEDFPLSILDDCSTESVPPFMNTLTRDFRLDGNSTLWDGLSSIPDFDASEVSTDILGMPRSTFSPDIGCYERN